MSKVLGLLAVPIFASMAGAASAQNSAAAWDGLYAGLGWGVPAPMPAVLQRFRAQPSIQPPGRHFPPCPSGGITGGLQIGETFQINRLVWGVGADLDFMSSKEKQPNLEILGRDPAGGQLWLCRQIQPQGLRDSGARG